MDKNTLIGNYKLQKIEEQLQKYHHQTNQSFSWKFPN